MSETIYLNGVNGKKTMYGTRLSLKADKFIEELKQNANEAGYVNVIVKDRKTPDKYGNNVYIVLDTWKPDPSKKSANSSPRQFAEPDVQNDGLPF
jgi:hypothetical protein